MPTHVCHLQCFLVVLFSLLFHLILVTKDEAFWLA